MTQWLKPRRSARTFIQAAVLFCVAATGACSRGSAADKAPVTNAPVSVGPENIAIVRNDTLYSGPSVSGTLTPEDEATVRAEVSGAVLQTFVDRGQTVHKGQVLARIDDTAIRQQFLSAQSGVQAAQIAYENAKLNDERQEKLYAAGAVAQTALEGARSALSQTQAGLENAKAQQANAAKLLEKTSVRAPFDGIVSERQVSAGDVVQPGGALVTVVDPSSMRLEASVPAADLSAIKVGMPVQFTVSGYNHPFTGTIKNVNPTADPGTGQVRLYVHLPNAERTLVGGLFAEGRVSAETHRGLSAPIGAVDQRGLQPAVLRLKNGKAERVLVQLGLRDEKAEIIELRSGVAAGDTLLIGGAQGISPGTAVRVIVTNDRTTAER